VNEQELPRKVAQRLEEGLDTIPPAISYRLRAAREAALARVEGREVLVGRSAAGALAGAPGRRFNPRILAPALALVLALLGMLYWQQAQQRLEQNHADARYADIGDFDADVLADELPVTAYLDQGFEVWLYHHSSASEQQQ
jgi:hypothetical protein